MSLADTREGKESNLVSRPTDRVDPQAFTFEYAVDKRTEAKLRSALSEFNQGSVSASELEATFERLGHKKVSSAADAARIISLLDSSGDSRVEITDLIEAIADVQAARLSFENMDRKARGYVSLSTVIDGLWQSTQPAVRAVARATARTREQLALMVEAYDENGDGVMQCDEFVAMFCDLKHGRMSAARERGENARERVGRSMHAWSELEWLADELGLGLRTQPHAAAAPTWTKFAVAGLGGATGWLVVHPLDVAKTRAQLAPRPGGLPSQLRAIWQAEGVRGLYGGLSAAMARQLTYTTARVGLYDVIRDRLLPLLPPEANGQGAMALGFKLSCGLAAGGIAAALSCPVEVSLVRMQADGLMPKEQQRRYRHVGHAIFSIMREEGPAAGWRGVGATVGRGMLVSMTQLGTYDHAKGVLKHQLGLREGVQLHLSAALVSGLAYSAISLPADNAKTQLQNQRPLSDGRLPLRSMWDALKQTAGTHGAQALWRGFPAYFARSGGHTVAMFLCVEQYRKGFDQWYGVRRPL